MTLRQTLRVPLIVAVLAACAMLEFGAREARSQVVAVPAYETVYVPGRVKVKVKRWPRAYVVPSAVVPTTYVTSPTTYVTTPTTYVTTPTTYVTRTRYVETLPVVSAPVVERSYVVPTTTYVPSTSSVVETRYLQPIRVDDRPIVVYPY